MHSKIKSCFQYIRLRFLESIKGSFLLLKIYYLFNGSFDREIEYVHYGRLESLSSRYSGEGCNPNLRRQIHRIEKGLNRPDRKFKFGNEAFKEILNEFDKIKNISEFDKNDLKWIYIVLVDYREHCFEIDKLDVLLKSLVFVKSHSYRREYITKLEEIIINRRSTRYFLNKQVNLERVYDAINIAKEAPTACNRQPYSIHLILNKNKKDRIIDLAPGTSGFGSGIPLLAVVVGHASSFRFERDRHLLNFDAGLFVSQFLLLLEEKELNTCICNWTPHYKNDNEAINLLDLDKSKTIVCLIAIGYGDASVKRPISYKRSHDNLMSIHD